MEDQTPRGPIVSRESDREWETWSEEDVARRGLVHWKTLISAGVTHSEQLTVGIASIPPARHCTNTGTGEQRSTSSSKGAGWYASAPKRYPSKPGRRCS